MISSEKSRIISDIQELYDKLGKVPRMKDYYDSQTAKKVFGTWKNALIEALGKETVANRSMYSRKELVKFYVDLSDKLGHAASLSEIIADKDTPAQPAFYKVFPSMMELAEATKRQDIISEAKIRESRKAKKWSADELVEGYNKLTKKLGHVPTYQDINDDSELPGESAFRINFGSLENMRDKYDLSGTTNNRQKPHKVSYSKNEIIRSVAKFYAINNRFPQTHEITVPILGFTKSLLFTEFRTGSVNTAWKKIQDSEEFAKVVKSETKFSDLTDEQMLDRIREYYRVSQKIPTSTELAGSRSIRNRFGTWSAALNKALGADFEDTRVTKERIVNDIRSFYKKYGRAPRYDEYKFSKPARNRFGTWNNAITKALGKDNLYKHNNYSRDELIKDYQRLSDELGHAASVNEIDDDKRMPAWPVYAREFGSIIKLADEAHLSAEVVERWQDNSLKSWTADQLLSGYRELEKKLSRIPTGDDINAADDLPSTNVYTRVFGSLTLMREKYNLQKPSRGGQQPIPKETLVRQVAEFYKINNRFPVQSEFKPNGISRSALLNRFNTASLKTVWKEILNEPTFKKIIKKR